MPTPRWPTLCWVQVQEADLWQRQSAFTKRDSPWTESVSTSWSVIPSIQIGIHPHWHEAEKRPCEGSFQIPESSVAPWFISFEIVFHFENRNVLHACFRPLRVSMWRVNELVMPRCQRPSRKASFFFVYWLY